VARLGFISHSGLIALPRLRRTSTPSALRRTLTCALVSADLSQPGFCPFVRAEWCLPRRRCQALIECQVLQGTRLTCRAPDRDVHGFLLKPPAPRITTTLRFGANSRSVWRDERAADSSEIIETCALPTPRSSRDTHHDGRTAPSSWQGDSCRRRVWRTGLLRQRVGMTSSTDRHATAGRLRDLPTRRIRGEAAALFPRRLDRDLARQRHRHSAPRRRRRAPARSDPRAHLRRGCAERPEPRGERESPPPPARPACRIVAGTPRSSSAATPDRLYISDDRDRAARLPRAALLPTQPGPGDRILLSCLSAARPPSDHLARGEFDLRRDIVSDTTSLWRGVDARSAPAVPPALLHRTPKPSRRPRPCSTRSRARRTWRCRLGRPKVPVAPAGARAIRTASDRPDGMCH